MRAWISLPAEQLRLAPRGRWTRVAAFAAVAVLVALNLAVLTRALSGRGHSAPPLTPETAAVLASIRGTGQLPLAELSAQALQSVPSAGVVPQAEVAAQAQGMVAVLESVARFQQEQAEAEAAAAAAAAARSLPYTSAPFAGPLTVTRMVIPRLGVNNYIEPTSIYAGQMQAPGDGVSAVGWYYDTPVPGSGGNAIFAAHETWNRSRGPFYSLAAAHAGDEVVLQMANGQQYHYVIFSNNRYSIYTIPMGEIVWPSQRGNEEWITLMTCGGRFVPTGGGFGEFLDRDVVVARRVS